MPKLEPKQVQQELEKGMLWPVYWLYGQERMKARELLKRIRKAALGAEEASKGSMLGMAEETFDGGETDAGTVLDAAQSMSLGGGLRFIIVRDAHQLKNADSLVPLLTGKAKREELASVCVFLSKDLDARKKFSKQLIEKAAVVPCEEIAEADREPWIQYLAKRRGLNVPPNVAAQLISLDPWNLDIIDQELEKFSLALESKDIQAEEVVLAGAGLLGGSEAFLEAFFHRDLKGALPYVKSLAENPDESLPLLGLLAWNVRQLAAGGAAKLNPYVAQRIARWQGRWKMDEIVALQSELAELDYGFKQTPLLPLGLWTSLVTKFCR